MPTTRDACLAIFDHDGVLVDSLEFHQEAWFEMGRRTGLNFTPEFIHETFGMTNPSIFKLLLGDSIPPEQLQRYSDLKEECYRDLARGRIHLMDGVRAVLDALTAHGVMLAIGSSGVRPNLDLTVKECGLDGRFAAIASLEDITRGKPDPQVFLVAAAKAGSAAGMFGCLRGCPGRNPGRQGRRHVRRRPDHDPPGCRAVGRRGRRSRRKLRRLRRRPVCSNDSSRGPKDEAGMLSREGAEPGVKDPTHNPRKNVWDQADRCRGKKREFINDEHGSSRSCLAKQSPWKPAIGNGPV